MSRPGGREIVAGMEIRISLERVEPPAGRLWRDPGPGPTPRAAEGGEVPFTGWLGLLRALYEVLGQPGGHSPGGGLSRGG